MHTDSDKDMNKIQKSIVQQMLLMFFLSHLVSNNRFQNARKKLGFYLGPCEDVDISAGRVWVDSLQNDQVSNFR